MKCFILAGGFGQRLHPLTEKVAKPLLMVTDRPILTHIIERIPESLEIFVSTNERYKNQFFSWRDGISRDVEILIENSTKEDEKVGAVSALCNFIVAHAIGEDLLVVAGDNLFDFFLESYIAHYDGTTLVGIYDIGDLLKAHNYGVVRMNGRRVVEFHEKPVNPPSSLISTGIYIFPAEVQYQLQEFCAEKRDNIGSFIEYLMRREEVHGYIFHGRWHDIGTLDAYQEACAQFMGKQ